MKYIESNDRYFLNKKSFINPMEYDNYFIVEREYEDGTLVCKVVQNGETHIEVVKPVLDLWSLKGYYVAGRNIMVRSRF